MTKRIVCAAIRNTTTGRIIIGARHFDGVMITTINYSKEDWSDRSVIDQRGNFLTRSEAFIVATENNQIIRLTGAEYRKELYSENLY